MKRTEGECEELENQEDFYTKGKTRHKERDNGKYKTQDRGQ